MFAETLEILKRVLEKKGVSEKLADEVIMDYLLALVSEIQIKKAAIRKGKKLSKQKEEEITELLTLKYKTILEELKLRIEKELDEEGNLEKAVDKVVMDLKRSKK